VKAIEAIRLLAQWKKELNSKTPIIEAQFIVMKHNEFQIPDFKTTAKDWGADKAVLKTAQIDLDRVESLMPNQIRYSRYAKQTNGTWQLKKRLKNSCWRQWSGAVIAVNGDVLPCCFDKNGDHVFGNLHENSFNDIWNGEKATAFRQAILSDRKQFAICRNCTE
jgi:radical SAM protein with 4Fe4S-binding SPASM domain